MTHPDDPTPYRGAGARATRRRTLLIVVAAILAAVIALVLHAVGVLPPS